MAKSCSWRRFRTDVSRARVATGSATPPSRREVTGHRAPPAPFDEQAPRYDAWYDALPGSTIFADELAALEPLVAGLPRPWLEVGAGSGRFSQALGIEVGADPAMAPLLLAQQRGVGVVAARGEELPFRDGAFGAVLLALTLCFVTDPLATLRDIRRVLRPGGGVILGVIPAEGAWGRRYRQLAAEGHHFYRHARFSTREELRELLARAGFVPVRARSALFWPPDDAGPLTARAGDDPAAGFAAWLALSYGLSATR